MADIMMMANPAPPASCMIPRHNNIIGLALDTSRTESPVVVHPLIDSNTALEKGMPMISMRGQAEKTMTNPQPKTTMMPPSRTESGSPTGERNPFFAPYPMKARQAAETRNARAWGSSSGWPRMITSGVSMIPAEMSRIVPMDESIAA